MNKNNIHVAKAKIVLLEDEKRKWGKVPWGTAEDSKSLKAKYIELRKNDPQFKSIIGAFYESRDHFYYIEKYNNEFILTRHLGNFARITLLQDDELVSIKKNLGDMWHISVAATALYVDIIKNRMGL